jgi:hypothetical protein
MKTYVLRDIISINDIQRFCQQAPNRTIGQLAEAQRSFSTDYQGRVTAR